MRASIPLPLAKKKKGKALRLFSAAEKQRIDVIEYSRTRAAKTNILEGQKNLFAKSYSGQTAKGSKCIRSPWRRSADMNCQ